MKYRKVTFIDHPILGSVSFDFTDAAGKTVDTIILAGENGCGKSLFLSFLNNYNPSSLAKQLGYKLRVEVEFSVDDINMLKANKNFDNVLGKRFTGNVVTFVHDTIFQDDNSRVEFRNLNDAIETEYAFYFSNVPNIFRTVFSDVEINFTPNKIKHITSNRLDSESIGSIRTTSNLATEITQLLIDIDDLDNAELGKWVDSHRGQVPVDDVLHKRIRRFTNAFDKIFPNKRFVGIDNKDDYKIVLFKEFGKQMEISQLSSGEKQIVFRGGFLLRNQGTINGAPILVDEPELSLHPKWQLKILNFLKSLFTNANGVQTSQLIVATHSPFILHNNSRANDKVIVMKKDDNGNVQLLDKPEYYSWSDAIAVEDAFNVSSILNKDQVVVFLEGETDEVYYKKAMDLYGFDSSKLSFNWIGRYVGGNRGKAENTGDNALNNAASFFKANPIMMQTSKIYLLYDCDTKKNDEQEGNLYIGAMTKNVSATQYQKGIENLLLLPSDFDYAKYYKKTSKVDGYGATRTIEELDKISLSQDIISLPNAKLIRILNNLKTEIDIILKRTA